MVGDDLRLSLIPKHAAQRKRRQRPDHRGIVASDHLGVLFKGNLRRAGEDAGQRGVGLGRGPLLDEAAAPGRLDHADGHAELAGQLAAEPVSHRRKLVSRLAAGHLPAIRHHLGRRELLLNPE